MSTTIKKGAGDSTYVFKYVLGNLIIPTDTALDKAFLDFMGLFHKRHTIQKYNTKTINAFSLGFMFYFTVISA